MVQPLGDTMVAITIGQHGATAVLVVGCILSTKHLFHFCTVTVFYSMLLTQSFCLLSRIQTHHHP